MVGAIMAGEDVIHGKNLGSKGTMMETETFLH
jgi:hypothetical protein